jgi:hypothetical protein
MLSVRTEKEVTVGEHKASFIFTSLSLPSIECYKVLENTRADTDGLIFLEFPLLGDL